MKSIHNSGAASVAESLSNIIDRPLQQPNPETWTRIAGPGPHRLPTEFNWLRPPPPTADHFRQTLVLYSERRTLSNPGSSKTDYMSAI